MVHTYGLVVKGQSKALFSNVRSTEVSIGHEDYPGNYGSKNAPRADRKDGQDPILGDDGYGKVGRWQEVKISALENIVEQIVEEYLRDKTWYGKVRCREALWNMYRRIRTYVLNQIEPNNSQYSRVLQLMRDCIECILSPVQTEQELLYKADFTDSDLSKFDVKGFKVDVSPEMGNILRSTEPGISEFNVSVDIANDGELNFRYGGQFFLDDKLEVFVNNTLVWKGIVSTRLTEENPIRILLDKGKNNIKFKYTSMSRAVEKECWIDDIQINNYKPITTKEVPSCPAPYQYKYSYSWFNHFDGKDTIIKAFSLSSLPKLETFPGLFRYVSSSEDIEWELVHSVSDDENSGDENILKIDLTKMPLSTSSKITYNWRYRNRGKVKFKFLASVQRGDGLLFFINGKQVGGEYSKSNDWKEVEFNLPHNGTYKFDFMVRNKSGIRWGKNAVYIKDLENIEIIGAFDPPAPLDYDKLGKEAFAGKNDWVTIKHESVTKAFNFGKVVKNPQVFEMNDVTLECDGKINFTYKMGVADVPSSFNEYSDFYVEQFEKASAYAKSLHDSTATSHLPWGFKDDVSDVDDFGRYAETTSNNEITYDITQGSDTFLRIYGAINIECPDVVIDHYKEDKQDIGDLSFALSGPVLWNQELINGKWHLKSENFVQGVSTASFDINMQEKGYFTFNIANTEFYPSESFQIFVNGRQRYFYDKSGGPVNNIKITLAKGVNRIDFKVVDTLTETNETFILSKTFDYDYHTDKLVVPDTVNYTNKFNSSVSVYREWYPTGKALRTLDGGKIVKYGIWLNPGAKFELNELVRVSPKIPKSPITGLKSLFEEDFRVPGITLPNIHWDHNWRNIWIQDEFPEIPGHDGVLFVRSIDNVENVVTIDNIYLSKPGFIEFQYGGILRPGEYVDVLANGVAIATFTPSTTLDGQFVYSFPLPQGTSVVQFVYKDKYGVIAPVEGDSQVGGDDNPGDTCYYGGNNEYTVIGSGSWSKVTPRNTKLSATEGNTVITRTFSLPNYVGGRYTEKLSIINGHKWIQPPQPPDTKTLDVKFGYIYPDVTFNTGWNIWHSNSGYFAQRTLTGRGPLDPTPIGIITDFTGRIPKGGKLNISFDFLTNLKDQYPRAMVQVQLVRFLGWGSPIPGYDGYVYKSPIVDYFWQIHEERNNIGKTSKDIYNLDFSSSKHFQFQHIVQDTGNYGLFFNLWDLNLDNDKDSKGNDIYYAFKNVKFTWDKNTPLPPISKPDNTGVRVEFIDLATNQIVSSKVYYADADISFVMEPGKQYKVKYTLLRDQPDGNFSLDNGLFQEHWESYCVGKNGYYKNPNPPPPNINVPKDKKAYVVVDAIKIFESPSKPCDGSEVKLSVFEEGTFMYNKDFYNTYNENANVVIENKGDHRTYNEVVFEFKPACTGDSGILSGGNFKLTEAKPPKHTFIDIAELEFFTRIPIYMGGCYDSDMVITLETDDGQQLFETPIFKGGLESFEFPMINFENTGSKKFKVRIKPNQQGKVSSVTGKSYLTKFQLKEFVITEEYIPKPAEFDSELDFYIDGELVDTFKEKGGFFKISHSVPKGKHSFSWVFKTNAKGFVWDYASLDYVQITNWVCDSIKVVPYCEKGGGDKCIEALIRCLLKYKSQPNPVTRIGQKIWLFT